MRSRSGSSVALSPERAPLYIGGMLGHTARICVTGFHARKQANLSSSNHVHTIRASRKDEEGQNVGIPANSIFLLQEEGSGTEVRYYILTQHVLKNWQGHEEAVIRPTKHLSADTVCTKGACPTPRIYIGATHSTCCTGVVPVNRCTASHLGTGD